MVALVDTVITVTPVAFIAVVALPITGVGIGSAYVAESAYLYPLLRIVFAHEHMRRGRGFGEWRHWSTIPMPNEDMRVFVVGWVASFRRFSFVTRPSGPSEPEPVLASFAETIAAQTDVVPAIITTAAVVMELVLYAVFATALTRYVWLCIKYRQVECRSRSVPRARLTCSWVSDRARKGGR
jgi:hypothetical protein